MITQPTHVLDSSFCLPFISMFYSLDVQPSDRLVKNIPCVYGNLTVVGSESARKGIRPHWL